MSKAAATKWFAERNGREASPEEAAAIRNAVVDRESDEILNKHVEDQRT